MSTDDSSETERLLQRVAGGDEASWGILLTRHEEKMRRMVTLRTDRRLQGRVDPRDVIQEAYVEASEHRAEYLRRPSLPFVLWLRGIVGNKLREVHRRHLGTQMRDAGREISLNHATTPEATSAALAGRLVGHGTRPSEAAMRAEAKALLIAALNAMDAIDREVLALRHFEQPSPSETARVLGITDKAAGMRYVRAVKRLKDILAAAGMVGSDDDRPRVKP